MDGPKFMVPANLSKILKAMLAEFVLLPDS
jgi:hypothetical protein